MMNKLNIQLKDAGDESAHSFYLLMEEITLSSAKQLVEWIFEANFAEERPDLLNLIICSPGGDLNAAFAVIDTMKGSKIPIYTYGMGEIASCGLMTFMAGEKGKRFITRNTAILSHQYSWGSWGKEHELMAKV
jgi:ATP-dependent Clp protease protease subunit